MTKHIRIFKYIALVACSLMLSGCAETQLASHFAKKVWPGQDESKGTYKVGNPYKVGKVWYYPEENFKMVETGIASWYGPGFHESTTANGEVFDQNELTAAHRTLQLPSIARVTNLENGRSVVVRVNDRGPFKNGRIMDVSRRAADLLGFINKGTARVRIEVLEKESRILAEAGKRGEDTTKMALAEMNNVRPAAAQQPVRVASASNTGMSAGADSLPESLQTPTITVEELKGGAAEPAPVEAAQITPAPVAAAAPLPPPDNTQMAAGKIEKGRFMPAPVVSKEPVRATGIFVQAGSFSVYDNAEKLTQKLVGIAPTVIEPVTINAKKLYRVKLGPIASVETADKVLEKVIGVAEVTPKIVKTN